MSQQERILPTYEWDRLKIAQLPPLWRYVRPGEMDMVVVENDARIVACCGVLRVPCFEGLWMADDHRGNAGTARRLMRIMVAAANRWANGWAFGAAADDHMRDILARIGGQKLPADFYVLPLQPQRLQPESEGSECRTQ